jgi:hypothetical protein
MARTTSKKYSIDLRDTLIGLAIAVGTAALIVVQDQLSGGDLTFNWKEIGASSIAAGAAYLIKKFLDPQQKVEVVKKDDQVNP